MVPIIGAQSPIVCWERSLLRLHRLCATNGVMWPASWAALGKLYIPRVPLERGSGISLLGTFCLENCGRITIVTYSLLIVLIVLIHY